MIQVLINGTDYTRYVGSGSLVIEDKINSPSHCSFTLTNNDNTFVVPSREMYVQIFSKQYNRYVFTGFIVNDIPKDFVGLNGKTPSTNFQMYRYSIECSSDEYLLGAKAVPILPPFVNLGAGQILALLANTLAPGFFDVTSQCASGDLVPYMEYDPNKTWVDTAKTLADQFRYRVRILNKVLYYKPWGDLTFPITYDETAGSKTFDPSLLKTTIFDSTLVNDAFVLGDVEAGDNHEDYFVGDGFTGNFPLRYSTFESSTDLLMKQDWTSGGINTSQWFEQDPTNAITTGGALNVNNGTNHLGETYLYLRTGVDLGRKVILEHGEIFFIGNCGGNVIPDPDNANGTWTGDVLLVFSPTGGLAGVGGKWTYTGTGVAAGFHFRISQVFPVVPGQTYTISGYINGSNVTVGNPTWLVYDPTIATQYGVAFQNPGVNGRVTGTFTVPGGVTQVVVLPDTSNCTVTNGQPLIWSNPQLEIGSVASAYNAPGLVIGGVYDNANTFAEVSGSGQCECGFDVRPAAGLTLAISVSGVSGLQIQPRRLGNLFGQPLITQQNHYYILRTIIDGRAHNRYTSTFKSFTGAIVQGGTNNALADITWVIYDINLNNTNPNQPGFVNTQPPITEYRFTLKDQVVPAFALYALVNVSNANFTVQWTSIFDPPQGTLSVAGLSGVSAVQLPLLPQNVGQPLNYELGFGLGRQVATVGNSESGGGGDGTGSQLQFYSDSLPGVGSRIRFQAWEAQTAIARVQDPTSIAREAGIVGDDGHRMAMLTDFKPLPRSSEECELAGKAALLDRTTTIYQGTYGPIRDIFFDFSQNLLLFSEQFDNSVWVSNNGASTTVVSNSTVDPFGNLTADKIVGTSTSNGLFQIASTSISNGQVATFSIWLKAISGTQSVDIYVARSPGNADAIIKTVVATTTWQRFTVQHNSTWTGTSPLIVLVILNNPGSVFAWGAQLELNISQGNYIQTIGSIVNHDYPRTGQFFTINSPQRSINNLKVMVSSVKTQYLELFSEQANITIGFGPTKFLENLLATFVPKPQNVLMPKDTAAQPTPVQLSNVGSAFAGDLDLASLKSATNWLPWSTDLTNPAWGNNHTAVSGTFIDPFGALDAQRVYIAIAGGIPSLGINSGSIPSDGVSIYTFSFWVKGDTSTSIMYGLYNISDGVWPAQVGAILSGPGSISQGPPHTISGLTSTQWTKVQTVFTGPVTLGKNLSAIIYPDAGGNTLNHGVLVWGPQVEKASYASAAYAPTTNNAPQTFPPGLGHDSLNAYFDIGVTPVSACEVRRANFGWGVNNNDRLGSFTTRTFSMPRTQFDQTWYLRQINGPFISRRSKAIRIAAPIVPAAPGLLGLDSSVIQANFNGDIRNVYGIELRGPDNFTIITQRPVGAITDMYFDLKKLNAGRFWQANNFLLQTEEFDNPIWAQFGSVSVSANAAMDPNNLGQNADLIQFGAGVSGTLTGIRQSVAVNLLDLQNPVIVAGSQFTFSVWLSTSGGTAPIELVIEDVPFTTSAAFQTFTVTSTPTRYSITGTFPVGTNNTVGTWIRQPFGIANGAKAVFAWGAQLELSGSMSSYTANVDRYGMRNLAQATEEYDNSDFWLTFQSPSTTGGIVPLTLPFNSPSIALDQTSFNTTVGIDAFGSDYLSSQLGTSLNFAGVPFTFGTVTPGNNIIDNFPINLFSPQWTTSQGSFTVSGGLVNEATQSGGGRALAVRNDPFMPADQFAQATVAVAPTDGTNLIGLAVRGSQTANTYYGAHFTNTGVSIFKIVAGAGTSLASNATTCIAGDIIKFQIIGTNLTLFKNGVSILTASDSAITAGYPGFEGAGTNSSGKFSNFICTGTLIANTLSSNNVTLTPTPDYYSSIRLLGTSAGAGAGNASFNVPITLVYSDGTSTVLSQNFSDWASSGATFTNESVAKTMTTRAVSDGTSSSSTNVRLYHYFLPVDATKKLIAISFPTNKFVSILAANLIKQSYGISVVPNAVVDPLGNLTADQINFGPKSAGQQENITQYVPVSLVRGKTFTFSTWLRTSGANIAIDLIGSDSPFTQNAVVNHALVTNQWQRFVATGAFTNLSGVSGTVVQLSIGPTLASASGAIVLYAWGTQLEYGNNPTTYLGNGNVFRPFYLNFFNTMWTYGPQTSVFIASPPAPNITLGSKLANNIEIRCDQLARNDIRRTVLQISKDGSFLTTSTITVSGNGQPATFNVNTPNAAGSAFFARARRTDFFGDGAWSPIIFIPYGNVVSSVWIGGQGSISPTLDNQASALFSYTASANAPGGANTGRIVITWPNFIITFPDLSTQSVLSSSYDTGTILTSSTGGTTPYVFYPRLKSQIAGSLPEFVNGPHTGQSNADAQLCQSDGYIALGGKTISMTCNVPTAPASGGPSSGGGTGGGSACIPEDEIVTTTENMIQAKDITLDHIIMGADPETKTIHWNKVTKLSYSEESCIEVTLDDGSKGSWSKSTDIPVWIDNKFQYVKPRQLNYCMLLLNKKGELSKIKSIAEIGYKKVVMITVIPYHTLFAGDILTHNNVLPKT